MCLGAPEGLGLGVAVGMGCLGILKAHLLDLLLNLPYGLGLGFELGLAIAGGSACSSSRFKSGFIP